MNLHLILFVQVKLKVSLLNEKLFVDIFRPEDTFPPSSIIQTDSAKGLKYSSILEGTIFLFFK